MTVLPKTLKRSDTEVELERWGEQCSTRKGIIMTSRGMNMSQITNVW
jgi:hypothetical protein